MSAGDIAIKGWFGGTPAYKEIRSPEVSYEPSLTAVGVNVRKKLTRTIVCPSKDVQAVLQSLSVNNAAISTTAIGSDGATSSVSFGGGWTLKLVGSGSRGNAMTEMKLQYEKEVTSAFEFNLPTGLTITDANGKTTVAYNTHTLEVWDSGKGATNSGARIVIASTGYARSTRIYWTGNPKSTVGVPVYSEDRLLNLYSYSLLVDDVLLETFQVDESVIPSVTDWVIGKRISSLSGAGTNGAYTQGQIEAAVASYEPPYTVIHNRNVHGALAAVTGSTVQFVQYALLGAIQTEIPNITDELRRLAGTLYWETTGNLIRLMAGGFIWKEWDITGLTVPE